MADTTATKENFKIMAAYLRSLGLEDLFTVDKNGNPGGWLWNKLKAGVDTADELKMAIEETNVWKDRFAVIVEQRKRAAAGEPVRVMEAAEVIEYEARAAQLMRQYGMPNWFYDKQQDFNKLILAGMSVAEIEARLAGAYTTVTQLDPDIKAAFRQFYGVAGGDSALAAFFLDPDRTEAELDKIALASYAGGMAKDFGLQLKRDQAELFSLLGRTEAGVAQDLAQIASQADIWREGAGESTNLTQDTAFNAIVKGDATARRLLERRILERESNSRAGAGGALSTAEGLLGVSTAR